MNIKNNNKILTSEAHMARASFSIDEVVEMNERLAGYHGMDISFSNGMMGWDLDLESAAAVSAVISEIIDGKQRRKFKYIEKSSK